MKARIVDNDIILRLDIGDNIVDSLKQVCREFNIKTASISGIGATDDFTCGVFNISTKSYKEIHFSGMYEILSLCGNISRMNNEPYVHLHITVGDENCSSFGGHLIEARISATAEMFIHTLDCEVARVRDKAVGLNLLDI